MQRRASKSLITYSAYYRRSLNWILGQPSLKITAVNITNTVLQEKYGYKLGVVLASAFCYPIQFLFQEQANSLLRDFLMDTGLQFKRGLKCCLVASRIILKTISDSLRRGSLAMVFLKLGSKLKKISSCTKAITSKLSLELKSVAIHLCLII